MERFFKLLENRKVLGYLLIALNIFLASIYIYKNIKKIAKHQTTKTLSK